MPLTLNITTREFFAYENKEEQKMILRKLLNYAEPVSLDWKYNNNNIISLKSTIKWERKDRIINVPLSTEKYVLENPHMHKISLNI
jgi:hypothetical protein